MIYFFLNLFLALAWMLLNGTYTSLNFIFGFIAGFFVLRLTQPFGTKSRYFQVFVSLVKLVSYFCFELIMSAAQVMWDVLTPTHLSETRISFTYHLMLKSHIEITLLAEYGFVNARYVKFRCHT